MMDFWDLFPKTSPRPPIYLRNEMTGFKKNIYLIKTLIFNESICLIHCFAEKLPLKPSPKVCIPYLEVLNTSDFTHPHSTQVSRTISNFRTVKRSAPDPWLATTPRQPETVQGEHSHSHSILPALWVLQHSLQSEVSAPSTRDDRGANPGPFNNLTASEIKFPFG